MKDQSSTIVEPEAEAEKTVDINSGVMFALVLVVLMVIFDVLCATSLLFGFLPYVSLKNTDNNNWTIYEFFAYSVLVLSLFFGGVLKIGVFLSANRNIDQTIQRTNRVILIQLGLGGLWAILGLISAYSRPESLLKSIPIMVMWFSIGMYALYIGVLFAIRGLFRWK